LGDFPGGSFESSAQSVSADGAVVTGYSNAESGSQAFMWTENTGMVSLGNLPDNSFKASWANSISADGKVIVGYGDPVGDGWNSYKGFIWTATNGMSLTGSLDGAGRSMAFDVSADGSVVVGDGGQQAFRWQQSEGITGLGTLPGKPNSRAVAVSADGMVATGSSYNSTWTSEETFRWTQDGGIQGLGFLSGTSNSFPNAISPDGSVIAGTSASSSRAYAYRWTASTGMVNIGNLPGAYTTHPGGVSQNGEIIVGGSYVNMSNGQAFIWDSVNKMRNLKTVLQTEYGLDLTGWTLQSASDITPDGNVIVGWGVNPSGQQEAFRVALDTTRTLLREGQRTVGPVDFKLRQNYPNPFNPITAISYQLGVNCIVKLQIYNTIGKEIKTLVDSYQNAGEHVVEWNGTDHTSKPVCSGVYLYSLVSNEINLQGKMILIR